MFSPVDTILRKATRKDKLNVIAPFAHERFQPQLCLTGHEFWSVSGGDIRTWNENYAPIPNNFHILDGRLGSKQIPAWIDADIVICQNIFAQLEICKSISDHLQIPLINIWHTLPTPNLEQFMIANRELWGTMHHVFISEFNCRAWGFNPNDWNVTIIHHGVDTDFWSPDANIEKEQICLSVVNDWINREWCCNFSQWNAAIREPQVPHKVIGKTPGLSEPSDSLEDLREEYRKAQVFINTSTISPIPMALLEGMSIGLGVISTNTCMIPDIIKDGYNGRLVDPQDVEGLNRIAIELLNNPEECKRLGNNARQTIKEMFSIERFVNEWNDLFESVLK